MCRGLPASFAMNFLDGSNDTASPAVQPGEWGTGPSPLECPNIRHWIGRLRVGSQPSDFGRENGYVRNPYLCSHYGARRRDDHSPHRHQVREMAGRVAVMLWLYCRRCLGFSQPLALLIVRLLQAVFSRCDKGYSRSAKFKEIRRYIGRMTDSCKSATVTSRRNCVERQRVIGPPRPEPAPAPGAQPLPNGNAARESRFLQDHGEGRYPRLAPAGAGGGPRRAKPGPARRTPGEVYQGGQGSGRCETLRWQTPCANGTLTGLDLIS